MFWMSLKSVPGCLVSIEPRLIGVPVALTPGLEPQEDTETAPAAGPDEAAAGADEAAELAGAAPAFPVPELELELHAASTPSDSAATATAAACVRHWTGLFIVLPSRG
jgi:hypothetical protein